MLRALRVARCYLYTGTQPASYTLGLIEALMTGIPVLSIGPEYMNVFPYGPDLFEGHEIAEEVPENGWNAEDFTPEAVQDALASLLHDGDQSDWSGHSRRRAIALFGRDKIAAEWAAYLGAP